jgi:hypothetical protein
MGASRRAGTNCARIRLVNLVNKTPMNLPPGWFVFGRKGPYPGRNYERCDPLAPLFFVRYEGVW